jgi:hypothetical protein
LPPVARFTNVIPIVIVDPTETDCDDLYTELLKVGTVFVPPYTFIVTKIEYLCYIPTGFVIELLAAMTYTAFAIPPYT